MSNQVRVRFAPSPTGPLHIGGVRTALFNYLFAKKHQGTFILRIEDTDQNRYVKGAEQYIINALNWCNIPFDEGPGKEGGFGPYRQSERQEIYVRYAEQLIASGHAYYAFDTAEDLDFHRKDHEEKGKTFIYNWHNREKLSNSLSLSKEAVEKKLARGESYVIRFKSPKDETLHLTDMIRGEMTIDTNILDDKVLFKSDGMPTYHLANIVDDHLMEITHVIRGEEWLPSLALHYQLYQAFGWEAPQFAHLPLILKPTGKGKLSKRDGDKLGFPVFPLEWKDPQTGDISRGYKEDGYFPEAMVNFMALLGWNPGTEQEIFSLNELVNAFELERVHKAGARFDPEKIKWFNHHYMQEQHDIELAESFKKQKSQLNSIDTAYIAFAVGLIKERATFISELWDLSHYFFEAPASYDEKAMKKAFKEGTKELLHQLISIIKTVEDFTVENLQTQIKGWITSNHISFGNVMMPLRLALVGALQGPDVFDIMFMIGKKETIKRIEHTFKVL
ncbi:MAG: glutamate--tRNA ligase [Flavobacteriales bacterium]|nr:glutamate--tRNA ligase [Flavobacteriia bacterium]NCP05921.1 glutamate--tRNA ligase [Flavobacteriales bacterium]PIV93855.1 MAG: glutamate--tRNA ligase [Flavobacteriaceae bacterium CG17_big_fil_post_rev_8_21_14_2_50_33_15]PIY09378.1 MAG: glutamate--tRNA ligase [Flavobacteriaceae bacterium CG_4_10_14_3_um_filter_33_47]PJB17654.1 MAG: glutamate--tRNA ligase [Flavobacteriaceae bacterium CG_4_9_14_3_um_filter_33_16]